MLLSLAYFFSCYAGKIRRKIIAIKKKTGKIIDGYGNILSEKNEDTSNPKVNLLKYKDTTKDPSKETKPITSYKPTGKIVYNDILESLKSSSTS